MRVGGNACGSHRGFERAPTFVDAPYRNGGDPHDPPASFAVVVRVLDGSRGIVLTDGAQAGQPRCAVLPHGTIGEHPVVAVRQDALAILELRPSPVEFPDVAVDGVRFQKAQGRKDSHLRVIRELVDAAAIDGESEDIPAVLGTYLIQRHELYWIAERIADGTAEQASLGPFLEIDTLVHVQDTKAITFAA